MERLDPEAVVHDIRLNKWIKVIQFIFCICTVCRGGIHRWLTFMPISMLERSAKGTSLVTSSQSNTAKLHISAERRLISSGFFCRAEITKNKGIRLIYQWKIGLNMQCLLSTFIETFGIEKIKIWETEERRKESEWVISTFWCHPCWRVHPAWTLERELHVCHAYPSSHVIINLVSWKQNTIIRISKHWF